MIPFTNFSASTCLVSCRGNFHTENTTIYFHYTIRGTETNTSDLASIVFSEPSSENNVTTWLLSAKAKKPGHMILIVEVNDTIVNDTAVFK